MSSQGLADDRLTDDVEAVHDYQLRDGQGQRLLAHGGIWLVELDKLRASKKHHFWTRFVARFLDLANILYVHDL
jgi:hypothetical protein